ncbi:MBL fold metallo-hydrolase [Streptomyces sp. ID05-04B]|uniref:MBL fold metallo-hydrolase n=1 Tax=unclassified Streptomyces TaxID=2593676 RepID=UPI000D1A47E8|nr:MULTISPECIES: MBL fold metallo-hydrolase [unclassified Streptomyces]AVV46629.1 MBL fold metallo-hydrolase [Streptomyces sp. P3]MDX5569613.1 MBL fold metallo-hydrolase [Streptomyces sp. ID05-04B]
MRLTKFGHACVRLEAGDRALVIDPGTFSEMEALSGVAAVLITHEHEDHIDVDKLKAARDGNPQLTVHTHAALALALGDGVAGVAPGDTFTAAGFTVDVVGGEHAEIIDGLPGCPNIGFIVDGVYHPGDSLVVPEQAVDTLLVPASGPWLKTGEAIEFVRAVRPVRVFPIHDANLSELGQENFDSWLEDEAGIDYARIPLGTSVDLH